MRAGCDGFGARNCSIAIDCDALEPSGPVEHSAIARVPTTPSKRRPDGTEIAARTHETTCRPAALKRTWRDTPVATCDPTASSVYACRRRSAGRHAASARDVALWAASSALAP